MIPAETDPVVVEVAGREVEGIVDDVRWTPRYNTPLRKSTAVAVNVGNATFVASPDQLRPR